MSARDRILSRLRERAAPAPTQFTELDYSVMHRPLDAAVRKTRFLESLRAARAEVIETTEATWTDALAKVLDSREITALGLGEIHPWAQAARRDLKDGRRRLVSFASVKGREAFERLEAGLTSSCGAIAETGSVCLWPDADEPRSLSLIPPVHIVVVDERHIYSSFFELQSAQSWHKGLPSNALLISGPSKTADIEQTLVFGAHGPKALVVLLITRSD
ncbi:LutC/YkgG family protein [Larsenimonas salina]|uniref:LutC/YkgG family protein n=1 Tax=Larsenimonas salina TaxID=1295565 RepID=UPI002074298A|nr:lactate utilization protein C [Larsenimonas salina]MCM5704734.1 lactate utilization protein [Larsenimonas salina]